MNKRSFFRGLGAGLVIGALVMTMAFSFDSSKTSTGQEKNTNISGQSDDSREDDTGTATDAATVADTEESSKTEAVTEAGADTEQVTKKADASDTAVNGKGDVYADGAGSTGSTDSGKTSSGGSNGSNGSNGNSGSNGSNGSSGSNGSGTSAYDGTGLSDSTTAVTSSKDNGYTEDKTSGVETAEGKAVISPSGKGGTITVVDGMTAYEICELLEEIGLRDADEYYSWLLRSGYSSSLVSGTYTFLGTETNGGIVWILLGHPYK